MQLILQFIEERKAEKKIEMGWNLSVMGKGGGLCDDDMVSVLRGVSVCVGEGLSVR